MWRPWIKSNSASYRGSLKKNRLYCDAKIIVKNVYSFLLRQGYNAGAAASVTSNLTMVPLTSVRRIVENPIESRKKRKDSGVTKSLDDWEKDLIRRKIFNMYDVQSKV